MIELRMIKNRKNGTGGAGFGVTRPKNHAPEAGLNYGSRAHRARFNCNIETALGQPVVPKLSSSASQGENLSVGARIFQAHWPVVSARNRPPAANDDRAYGHFQFVKAAAGLAQSEVHEFRIFRIFNFSWRGRAHSLS